MPAARSPDPTRHPRPRATACWLAALSVLIASPPGQAMAADTDVTVSQPAKIQPAAPPKPQPVVPPKVQPKPASAAGGKGTATQQALLKQRSTAVLKERTKAVLGERTTEVLKQRTSTVLKQRTTVLGSSAAQPGKIIAGTRAPPPKTIVTRRNLPK
jgi:hypothetical protein